MSVRIEKVQRRDLGKLLPYPAEDANKYTRGRLVAIGGDDSYPGAICLASAAAFRAGAGYVEVACAPETLPVLHAYNPNVVALGWDGWTVASARLDASEDGTHPRACLVGSGLTGTCPVETSVVLEALRGCACPVVVDGGAIAVLASEAGRALADARGRLGHATIVTPHGGEAIRLGRPLGLEAPEASAATRSGQAAFAQQLANAYRVTVMLKGPETFIASPACDAEGKPTVHVMTRGTAALAKAGTGDVLAGLTAGLVAQGMPPVAASVLGSSIHAEAGRLAAKALTEICVCATDVLAYVPAAIRRLAKA